MLLLLLLCRALEQNKVSLFFSESPTNPYLRCVDIPKIAELCAATDTIVCIDSTFATPVNSRALALGADLVIHSATKYLAGHNDVLAGAICGSADLVGAVSRDWGLAELAVAVHRRLRTCCTWDAAAAAAV
jgi:cystathionine gamma-synthase